MGRRNPEIGIVYATFQALFRNPLNSMEIAKITRVVPGALEAEA
jgi:ABC-type Fe3+-siderophore transport system permease subunit